jgi:cytoskeletal protein CcmA (bactofilin family)
MSLLKKLFGQRSRKSTVPPASSEPLTQLASAGPLLRGDVHTKAAGYFGCQLEGNLYGDHEVWLEPSGKIHGNVQGTHFSIEGNIHGDINAQGNVALKAKSYVHGNIHANSLTLEAGAQFKGLLVIGDEEKNLALNLKKKH